MRIIVLISALVFAFSGLAQPNQVDSRGRKQGEWGKTYPGTRVYQYKGQFKDDKPVGKFTYFYKSSKVKAIIKHGPNGRSEAYYYHENGVLMSYGIYKNFKKDSIWTNFGPSGRLSNKETFVNDSLHGQKAIYYVPEDPLDKSQRLAALLTYNNGTLHGEYKEYFESGIVKVKGAYVDGKKDGPWEEFHPNGKRSVLYMYHEGFKHGWAIAYDQNMKRIGKKFYYYGKKLEGKRLEEKLQELESKGINPNNPGK